MRFSNRPGTAVAVLAQSGPSDAERRHQDLPIASPRAVVLKLLALLGAALIGYGIDVSAAHAQSASCQRLQSTLETLDRNSSFRDVRSNTRDARSLRQQVQRDESRYIRGGCNDDAKAGRSLSRECRSLARDITEGRRAYEELVASVETGNAVAQQREALLQEIARFGCNSRVRVVREGGSVEDRLTGRDRGNIFDQLFDSLNDAFDGGGGYRDEGWDPWGDYHTVRTLCVRKTDGFYWPISYSTLTDYVPNDADQCRSMCPGLDVDLYYYDNPGQEPEQMINMYGEPYTALPNAFKFRTEFDKSASCTPQVDYGSIQIADLGGGQSRAVINFSTTGASFPLPLRDPRRQQASVTEAALEVEHFVDVPLPRRRPAAPGEEPKAVPVPPTTAASAPARIVQFGDKRVRIVGPDTPYAPTAEAGT
jgi:hypothetical protein